MWEQAKLLSRDIDAEWVDAVVHRIVERPGEGGSLHPRGGDDSLDAWTYRELCGLHALANLALLSRNLRWARRVQDVARYHMQTTQPDHVTSQPWALFAFLWNESTRPLAEQQLHDAAAAGGGRAGALAAMLLADAADALGRFE